MNLKELWNKSTAWIVRTAPEPDIYKDAVCLYGLKDPNAFNSITTICPRCRRVLAIPLKKIHGFTEPIVWCPVCGAKQKLTARQKEETNGRV